MIWKLYKGWNFPLKDKRSLDNVSKHLIINKINCIIFLLVKSIFYVLFRAKFILSPFTVGGWIRFLCGYIEYPGSSPLFIHASLKMIDKEYHMKWIFKKFKKIFFLYPYKLSLLTTECMEKLSIMLVFLKRFQQ